MAKSVIMKRLPRTGNETPSLFAIGETSVIVLDLRVLSNVRDYPADHDNNPGSNATLRPFDPSGHT